MDEPEPENDEDIDGAPLSDVDGDGTEDLDGVPLDGAALLKGAMKHGLTPQTTTNYDDIDGVPSKNVSKIFHALTAIILRCSQILGIYAFSGRRY